MRKYKNISSDGTVKYIRSRIGDTFEALCTQAGWNPKKVTYATEYADGGVGVYIPYDGGLEGVPNLWEKQALKIDKDGNKQIKYYQLSSDNTDLPFIATGWENGVIVERYIAQYPDPPLSGLDTDLQEKLTEFSNTHGVSLPDHDMSDPKLFCVSVNYDGDTPTNIDFHINLL